MKDKMTNDLLPCPFCQKDARIVKEGRNFENRPLYAIACKRHRCKVSTPTQTTLAAAIKIWNHRADLVSTPNKTAEVDLDALKRVVRGEKEGRYDMDYTYDLGWNAAIRAVQASGHIATGKGGDEQTGAELAAHDLMVYGVSFMKDGKRVDPNDVYKQPAATAQIDAGELPCGGVK